MKKIVVSVFSIFFSLIILSQDKFDSKKEYVIVKYDKSEFVGKILSSDAREILINTSELGQVYIPKHEIKEIRMYNPNMGDRWSYESKFALVIIFSICCIVIVLRTFRNVPEV